VISRRKNVIIEFAIRINVAQDIFIVLRINTMTASIRYMHAHIQTILQAINLKINQLHSIRSPIIMLVRLVASQVYNILALVSPATMMAL